MSEAPDQPRKIDLDQIRRDFVDYLDGKVAPLFAAESLSLMLRVEPPIYYTPKDIAELVANWAQLRATNEHRPVYEYYLKSIELIVTADRTGVLSAFKPSPFYMPYFEGLVRQCPAAEKPQFRERLKVLRELLFKEWGYEFRRAEFEVTATVESSGEEGERTPISELEILINRLRSSSIRLNPAEQHEIISQLQCVMGELVRIPGVAMMPHLEALISISISTFNAGLSLFSAQLLYIVQQIYQWEGFDPANRDCLRRFRPASALDEAHLRPLTTKPELLPALRVFLTHFDELSPYSLLNDLVHEQDRQKRRVLLALIEAHGEAAAPMIIDMLSRIRADQSNWFFVRNLIYLLGKVAPQDPEGQHVAINLINPYLRSSFFQLRQAALGSLESFTIDEALTAIEHIFDDKIYTEEQLNNQERISTYLTNAISLIARFDSQRAINLLVEISLGQHIDFISANLVRPLKLQAIQALVAKREYLSPPLIAPILERIRALTSRWKKLVSKLLGEDELELLAMLDLAAAVPTPQVIELLTDIRSRYANEMAGRRAAELLKK